MRTHAALPYLLPPDGVVTAEGWRTPDGVEIEDRLEHWDPFTDVEMVRVVTVDVDSVRDSCQLASDAALALVASWRSDRTRLAASGEPVELATLAGVLTAPVGIHVPGASAGGRLDVSTQLVLRTSGNRVSPIAPRRPGAILWTHTDRIVLEGSAARFPVSPTDFGSIPRLPEDAAWALEWNVEDLDSPVTAALRLLVNTGDEQLLEAIRSGSADIRATLIRSFVTYDVARSLTHGALMNDRFTDDPDAFDEGTLGRMLCELLTATWPGVPVLALRARLVEDPARLDAELQAYLKMTAR